MKRLLFSLVTYWDRLRGWFNEQAAADFQNPFHKLILLLILHPVDMLKNMYRETTPDICDDAQMLL